MNKRSIREGQLTQGTGEKIAYQVDVTPWGTLPSNVVMTALDVSEDTETDVTATVVSGSATVDGNNVTLPFLQNLVEEHLYRVNVKFNCGLNVFEFYFLVKGEK